MDDRIVLSVGELNKYVADKLSADPLLKEVWVRGEITGLNLKYENIYFSLKDDEAVVDCMLRADEDGAEKMLAQLEEGAGVLARGLVSIYFKSGRYRILVRELEQEGAGAFAARFKALKEKLEKQGVFDVGRKKPLPRMPRKIGIVTSKNGAAIHDIKTVASRRNPGVKLLLYSVHVQGELAPAEIIRGIRYFNERSDVDVLIVGRGGGSAEDLAAFNDEGVILAADASKIPIISAVGHENDYTLLDLAADFRAPTPSAAAEIAVPQMAGILDEIGAYKQAMRSSVQRMIDEQKYKIGEYRAALSPDVLKMRVRSGRAEIAALLAGMRSSTRAQYGAMKLEIAGAKEVIEMLNPEKIFARGYSIVLKEGKAVKSAGETKAGDELNVVLADGEVHVKVEEVILN